MAIEERLRKPKFTVLTGPRDGRHGTAHRATGREAPGGQEAEVRRTLRPWSL